MTVGQPEAAGDARPTRPGYISLLGVGAGLGTLSVLLYGTTGFSAATKITWVAGLVVLALGFASRTERLPRVAIADVVAPAALVALLAPLYVVNVYDWPVQVDSDEIVFMEVSARWAEREGADLFGLSDYFTIPVLPLVLLGRLGQLLGGVDLETMRLVHGAVGLMTIVASYALFRQLLPRPWAIFATGLLGLNHAFFMISRMALYFNTAVLVEVVALALLLQGLRRSAHGPTFLGGFVAGLGFYAYYPGRAVFILWMVYLAALAVLCRKTFSLRKVAALGAVAAVGFALMAGPMLIAERKAPPESVGHFRTELLVFPEGREVQKDWVFASSEWEGVRTNIGYGLGAFNNNIVDHSWIYENRGHGIVDPLTGALVWLGVLVVGWRFTRNRNATALLPLTFFFALWLTYAFVVNKAPNYGRMLIVLPFVAYFVAEAIRAAAGLAARVLPGRDLPRRRLVTFLVAALVVGVIGAWNVAIAGDYVREGRERGDDIGSTGRYVQARRDIPGISFHLAASDKWPYYIWGFPFMYSERLRMFAREGQVQPIVAPATLGRFSARRPFVLFLSGALWDRHRAVLERRYPDGRATRVMPDGSRIAFDVPRP